MQWKIVDGAVLCITGQYNKADVAEETVWPWHEGIFHGGTLVFGDVGEGGSGGMQSFGLWSMC